MKNNFDDNFTQMLKNKSSNDMFFNGTPDSTGTGVEHAPSTRGG